MQIQRWVEVSRVLSVLMAVTVGTELTRAEALPRSPGSSIATVSESNELPQASKTVKEWVAQIEATTVRVTGVSLNSTDIGLEIVLQTAEGKALLIDATRFRSEGTRLIAEIPNAVLALSEGPEFLAEDPTPDVTRVQVLQQDSSTIQVSVTGNEALPNSEVILSSGGIAYSLNPEFDEEPDEEIVVTGETPEGYRVPNASTATRTDTPLRDIPQSIQVVPQQVLEDQQVTRLQEALRNVSGVNQGNTFGSTSDAFVIRGFPATSSGNILRNGFRLPDTDLAFFDVANIDRVEVLKGPASVLYGNLEPGGVINIVPKVPLAQPSYEVGLQVGSFGLVRPTLDFTGPLNSSGTLRYRLNAAYERASGFRDYDQNIERYFIAPTLLWQISDRTDLTLDLEYLNDERPFDRGIVNDVNFKIPNIPFDRIIGEPDDVSRTETFSIGYNLEHRFNDRWKLRNAFRYTGSEVFNYRAEPLYDTDESGDTSRNFRSNDNFSASYAFQTNVVGNVTTGTIRHTILAGVDWLRNTRTGGQRRFPGSTTLNIFDPIYGTPRPALSELTRNFFTRDTRSDLIGFYLQDQIAFTDNLKLLVGGRFDIVDQFSDEIWLDTTTEQYDTAFTPRVGIVYQPIQPLSLYASYSRSFSPNASTNAAGDFLDPERGTQYEVGLRGELANGRLVVNLAAYDITKTNVATQDRDNPDFSVATGEVRSQGIELDVIGEILPGWRIIASYAYNDARVTEDNDSSRVGLRLQDAPHNTFSLWSTYEIQTGTLQGLGFGAGVFYVGDRIDGFIPSVTLEEYVRVDLGVFYRRDNWRVALNIKNLLNKEYIQSGFYNPGEPFTVVGSVSITF